MKDLLLFVPVDYFALAQFEYIPTGPLYLASFISEAGYDVDVLHGTVDEIKAGYKFYGISVTTATYSVGVAALKRIREIQPEAIVITGGPHYNAQLCIDLSLKDDWNFIVVGDGENGLLDIMNGKASASSRVVNGVEIEI
jgi:radical SAM superfamily enzyme YgiQ (UPF0313 family)